MFRIALSNRAFVYRKSLKELLEKVSFSNFLYNSVFVFFLEKKSVFKLLNTISNSL